MVDISHSKLSKEILSDALGGKIITKEDAEILMDPIQTGLNSLIDVSRKITEDNFDNVVEMCAIFPAKVGLCSGDCAYCAQSVHHNCGVENVSPSALDINVILEAAKKYYNSGVNRYSLVTSGEKLTDQEFESILEICRRIKTETNIALCASLGSLTTERARKLMEIGVTRYHHNIETSRNYFSKICTTHSFDEKLNTIAIAKSAGMEICCGGIISMGESATDRIDMAFELKNLDVDCVPINILNPIPGTKLENQKILPVEDLLRTIAVFRIILPSKRLRFAGGRENAFGEEEYRGLIAGINSMIVGNYLTTDGKIIEKEIRNIKKAGLKYMK